MGTVSIKVKSITPPGVIGSWFRFPVFDLFRGHYLCLLRLSMIHLEIQGAAVQQYSDLTTFAFTDRDRAASQSIGRAICVDLIDHFLVLDLEIFRKFPLRLL